MQLKYVTTPIAAIAITLAAASASAQTLASSPQRPTQGLFGSAPRGNQTLDVSASVVGAYEDNVVPGSESGAGGLDDITQESAAYNGVNTTVTYAKQSRRVAVSLAGGSSIRYYPALSDVAGMYHGAAGGFAFQLGHTKVSVTQKLRWAPYYNIMSTPQLFEPELAALPVMNFDQPVVRRDARSIGSTANVTQSVGRRLALTFASSLDKTDFTGDSTGLRTDSILGRMTYALSQDVSLVFGYRHQRGVYEGVHLANPRSIETTRFNTLDLGVDYHRALSLSRKTTVGFTTGTVVAEDFAGVTQYRMVGTARLNREIGRSGHATAAYNRGVEFIEGYADPMFADTFAVDVGGALSRRMDLSVVGGYSFGRLGWAEHAGRTENYNGSVRLRGALSRVAALLAEYHIYRYSFDQAGTLPTGILPQLDRQGVRVGIEFWLPLIR